MKDIQLIPAPGPVGLCPDAFHQVCVAFWIKHDGDFTPPDILGDQQLGQPGLTDARGAINHRMANALPQGQGDVFFVGLDAVQRRIPAHRR